jgi:GNAT superfamily N-acetyltransferase
MRTRACWTNTKGVDSAAAGARGSIPERAGPRARRAALGRSVSFARGNAHAALVFDGDDAVAWCQYGSPDELPNIHHRKEYEATRTGELPDYRITCIFVDRDYRRKGVAAMALRGAVELIAQAGGGVVEGYPHELAEGEKMRPQFL